MLKNRFILSIATATLILGTAHAGVQNIISTSSPINQQLTHDWYGRAATIPVNYNFRIEDDYLVFHAEQKAPASIHPEALPGQFKEGLWNYDTAEFFIADAEGKKYLEFNLCPNGAWWACAFDAPRHQMPEAGVPQGVETTGSVSASGWVCSARVPLTYLRSLGIDILNCRLATTCILNTPDYLYYTTSNDLSGEPDFHRPHSWSIANIRFKTLPGLSRNENRFYTMIQAMNISGDAPLPLKALAAHGDTAQVKAAANILSGHEYTTAMSSQLDGNLGHLSRLRAAMGKGSMLSLSPASANTNSPAESKASPLAATARPRPWRAGVSVFLEESNVDSDISGDGYNKSETGVMMNTEYITCDYLTLGGAISYGHTNLRTDGAMRRHEDNTRFDIYALYGGKRWNFATSLGLGIHEHELKRALGRADTDGYSINFMQDAGYSLLTCNSNTVQVFGTLESSRNYMKNFHDGMLTGAKQDTWTSNLTGGIRYYRALPAIADEADAGMFTARAGVTATIGDIKSKLNLSMNGHTYRQESATRNRWGWNLGAGVDVPVRSNVSAYCTAEVVLRGDSDSANAQMGVRVIF